MDKLRPCPFCGGDGSLTIDTVDKTVCGSCWTCGARGLGVWYKGDWPSVEEGEKAIRAWNRRADDGSA